MGGVGDPGRGPQRGTGTASETLLEMSAGSRARRTRLLFPISVGMMKPQVTILDVSASRVLADEALRAGCDVLLARDLDHLVEMLGNGQALVVVVAFEAL